MSRLDQTNAPNRTAGMAASIISTPPKLRRGSEGTPQRFGKIVAVALFFAALTGCPYWEPWMALPPVNGEHWLRFVQMTDIHVTDEESPARLVTMDSFVAASWRPQEAYAAQVLDATCRLVNRIHYSGDLTGQGPVDFVMVSGDLTDNAQYNELRWFMDTMDGGWVTPDSGALDGPQSPLPPEINPNLPFKAAGLAKDIPWYSCLGNHDNLGNGNFSIDRSSSDPLNWNAPISPTLASFIGLPDLNPPQAGLTPTGNQSLAILEAGAPEPINPNTYQLVPELLRAGWIPPDNARRYLSKQAFVAEHFNTRSFPAGHGFEPSGVITGATHYTFRPKTDVPVRVIVFDSVGPDGILGYLGASGAVSYAEFEGFLKPQLRAAKAAGEYVLLITHYPSSYFVKPTAERCVTPEEFIGYLNTQPHILAHISGHTHYNDFIMHDGLYSYPEIVTASLIEYPQQARMFDLYYDRRNEEFHLRSTFISHTEQSTALSQEAQKRMLVDAFADPEDPVYVRQVGAMDLSGFEELIEHAATGKRAPAQQPARTERGADFTLTLPARKF